MKSLITLFLAVALMTGTSSCGQEEIPPAETHDSSYEFTFLSGPLQGKTIKATGLSREQITSLYTEQPSENVKGILTQVATDNITIAAAIGLTANNQAQPFSSDDSSTGTQMYLTFTENGTYYAYGAQTGTPALKNLNIATLGGGAGGTLGLTTYELTFENATFSDEMAAGNGQNTTVRISGKISIK
jgi:hypothetical protein